MKNLLFVILLFLSFGTWAQDETDADTEQLDVTIIGEIRMEIRDANKMDSWPKYKENIVELPSITYSLIPNKIPVAIVPTPIKAAKINVEEKIKKLYKGYARGAVGTHSVPLLELYFMDGRSRKGSYMVHGLHETSHGGPAIDDSISDSYSRNQIELWGKRFIKKHTLQGNFNWERNKRNFYGFDPNLFSDANVDDIERLTFGIGADVALKSFYRDSSKVNYDVLLGFNNFRDNFDGVMNEIILNAELNKTHNLHHFYVDFNVNYNSFDFRKRKNNTRDNQTSTIVELIPRATTTYNDLKVNFGLNLTVDGGAAKPFHFYPLVEVKYNLFDNLFVPYVGLKGSLKQNTYQNLVTENPWVATDVEIKHENTKLDIYGGIRGTLTSNTSFNVAFSQKKYDDFAFFVNDSVGGISNIGSEFVIEYDELAVTELMGEVTVNESKKLGIFLKGQYFIYGLNKSDQPEAWYQPTTRFSMIGRYNIDNKIITQLEVYSVGKTKAKSLAPVADTTIEYNEDYYIVDQKGYLDVNLMVEYRYMKRLSAFVKVNNLISSKYMRYNNYRTQRLAAMIGLTYSF